MTFVKWTWWDAICCFFGFVSYDRACRRILRAQSLPKPKEKYIWHLDGKELLTQLIQKQIICISESNIRRKSIGFICSRNYLTSCSIVNHFELSLFLEVLRELGHGAVLADSNIYLAPFEPHLLKNFSIPENYVISVHLFV